MLDVCDLREIRSAREAKISPDGGRIAFCQTGMDRECDRNWSELHLVDVEGEGIAEEKHSVRPGRAPSWALDGSALAFILDAEAGEGAGTELLLLSVADGGKVRPLATLPGTAQAPVWSPDGKRLALVTISGPGRSSRIAIIELGTGAVEMLSGSEAGDDDDVPTWSPDGTRLAFARSPSGGGPTSSICVSSLTAADEPELVLTDLVFAGFPSWSPDGETLACVGTLGHRLGGSDPCLQPWVLPVAGGAARLAARGVNGVVVSPSPQGPVWSADGRCIFFREARAGDIHIASAVVDSLEQVRSLTSGSQVIDFSLSADSSRLAFSATSPADPGSVYLRDERGVRPLTASRGSWANRRGTLAPVPARREFRSPHGHSLDGWLQGLDRRLSPQPLLLSLHGGPHAFFGSSFQLGHFYRSVLASRGWLVLMLNGSGSGSYGEAFADSLRGRWGEYDLPEHLAAVDELIEEGFADPCRLVVAGYSYGGYLAAWAACMEDRFKAAIVGAPITNLERFERSSDIGGWYMPWEMEGGLPENAERYERLSPINHVSRLRTPTLILHGEADRRCPLAQSVEFSERAGREAGAAVELVRYADADHLFYASGRPSQRLDFNRRIVEWAEQMTEEGCQ